MELLLKKEKFSGLNWTEICNFVQILFTKKLGEILLACHVNQ